MGGRFAILYSLMRAVFEFFVRNLQIIMNVKRKNENYSKNMALWRMGKSERERTGKRTKYARKVQHAAKKKTVFKLEE